MRTPAVSEVQTLRTQATSQLSGLFIVLLGAEQTVPLAWNVSAADLAAALGALDATVGAAAPSVSVSAPDARGGRTWTVTFANADGDLPQMAVDASLLAGNDKLATAATLVNGSLAAPIAGIR